MYFARLKKKVGSYTGEFTIHVFQNKTTVAPNAFNIKILVLEQLQVL